MTWDTAILTSTIVSLLVITSPFDPVKILFFNQAIESPPRGRSASAIKVALYVLIVLGGTALAGRELLELLGVNLDAFRVVGGLIITAMGFEMLYGGGTSKTQGEDERQEGPEQADSLLIPLTLPLIAGPGAITTTITLASGESPDSLRYTLVGVAVVAVVAYVSYAWLSSFISRAKPSVIALGARLGGLLLATIGSQMVLGGIKDFFA